MDPLSATQADLAAAQAVGTGTNSFPGAAPDIARQRQADQSSAILKLKGLPYSASEDDIRQFFAPYELKSVSFVYEPDGRPSGLAFAEFVSKEEALKALSKNGEYIGQRYVRLLHVPRAEMEEQVRLGTLAIPGAAAKLRSRMIRSQQRNNAVYMATGPVQLMPTVMPGGRPVMAAMGPGGPGPNAAMSAPYSQPAGHGQVPVESRLWQPTYQQSYQQQQAAQQQPGGQHLQAQQPGGVHGYQSPAALAAQFAGLGMGGPQQQAAAAAGMQQPGGPQGLPRGAAAAAAAQVLAQPLAAQSLHMAPPPPPGGHFVAGTRVVQAATSPTIKIRGLPYGSSPTEILAFFQTYQYLPDTLQIGLDQLGRPSGEAWLSFSSPQEALRAVRDLNRHYLGNRYLELSIC
ncbi:hypothetical protein PLESTB_000652500 [Pleodorina starrii]|uniref:RRM domain-containing protein n=1 Tax=Pleodorina starrii TaxID=330485 RepID=A0A9W6BJB2_9CHLO|nr:hypothetical protein PLESTM_001327700 [Pleodorina starrii]GLC52642.1 hypothetical protein PLESTB_000652500 [Pleodorina starrii]GLC71650.1 hypothetical protein PLESTF_001145400 [Pleodorina starrii]